MVFFLAADDDFVHGHAFRREPASQRALQGAQSVHSTVMVR